MLEPFSSSQGSQNSHKNHTKIHKHHHYQPSINEGQNIFCCLWNIHKSFAFTHDISFCLLLKLCPSTRHAGAIQLQSRLTKITQKFTIIIIINHQSMKARIFFVASETFTNHLVSTTIFVMVSVSAVVTENTFCWSHSAPIKAHKIHTKITQNFTSIKIQSFINQWRPEYFLLPLKHSQIICSHSWYFILSVVEIMSKRT